MEKAEKDDKKVAAIEADIVQEFKAVFERNDMFKLTPMVEGRFATVVNRNVNMLQELATCSRARDTSTPALHLLPPLVLHFDNHRGNPSILMVIQRKGKPEILKNAEGSKVTPALAGYIPGKGLAYGTQSKEYSGPSQVWRAIDFRAPFAQKDASQVANLKNFGLFDLPRIFFVGYLLRKLKISVEESERGPIKVAILSLPIQIKSAQRIRLKEAALFAGFEEVYCVTAEGLAAYYFFSEFNSLIRATGYSTRFVIIDLFGHVVVYKRVRWRYVDYGNRMPTVEAVILLDLFPDAGEDNEKMEFRGKVKQILGTPNQNDARPIAIVRRKDGTSRALHLAEECGIGAAYMEEGKCEEYAVRGAALLSENLDNLRSQVKNMIGSIIKIGDDKMVIHPERLLPERVEKGKFKLKHVRGKYPVSQLGIGGGGEEDDEELLGYLVISGIEYGKRLKISYEVSWEGIWRVVKVCKCKCDNEGCCDEPVKWAWKVGEDQWDYANFGPSLQREGKKLLEKVLPSSASQSQGQPEVGNWGGRSSGEGMMNHERGPKVRKIECKIEVETIE